MIVRHIKLFLFTLLFVGSMAILFILSYTDNTVANPSGIETQDSLLTQQNVSKIRTPQVTSEEFAEITDKLNFVINQMAKLEKRIDVEKNLDQTNILEGSDPIDEQLVESSLSVDIESTQNNSSFRHQMDNIESRFFAQDIDPTWSLSAETRLQDAFSKDSLSNHSMQSLECRTSICKMEVLSQQVDEEAGGFHEGLREQISDILPSGTMHPNDTGGVTVYLAKDAKLLSIIEK